MPYIHTYIHIYIYTYIHIGPGKAAECIAFGCTVCLCVPLQPTLYTLKTYTLHRSWQSGRMYCLWMHRLFVCTLTTYFIYLKTCILYRSWQSGRMYCFWMNRLMIWISTPLIRLSATFWRTMMACWWLWGTTGVVLLMCC